MTYSVFPRVNTQERLVLPNDRVLVGVWLNANLAGLGVLHKPYPAAALDAGKSGIELLLELVQTAVRLINGFGQTAGRRITTTLVLGGEVLPEQSVIPVPAAMEINQWLESNLGSNVVVGLSSRILVRSVVVGVHVGLMVLAVMQLGFDLA